MDYDMIVPKAFEAARRAVEQAKAQHQNQDRGMCGFAWVEVENGRGKLAKYLKEKHGASKHWRKGVYIWNPGDSNWQNIDVTTAGARAFAAFFPGEAQAASRLD